MEPSISTAIAIIDHHHHHDIHLSPLPPSSSLTQPTHRPILSLSSIQLSSSHSSNSLHTSATSIATPLTIQLPPLPPITDPILRNNAITHVSYRSHCKHSFEEPQARYREDYEKLAMVGDAVVKDCLCRLINRIYPRLAIGVFTHITSTLLSNELFNHISQAYGIQKTARTSPASYDTLIEQVVMGGAMFEAHIGALTYDTQEVGIPLGQRKWDRSDTSIAWNWLEELFEPLVRWRYQIEKETISQGSSNTTTTNIKMVRKLSSIQDEDDDRESKRRNLTSSIPQLHPSFPTPSPTPNLTTTSSSASSSDPSPSPVLTKPIPPELLHGSPAWLNEYCTRNHLILTFQRHDAGGSRHRPLHRVEAYIDGTLKEQTIARNVKEGKRVVCALIRMSLRT